MRKGYFISRARAGQQPSPALFSSLTGLPPVLVGNKLDNSLSARCSSAIDLSKLRFSTAKLLPNFPSNYRRSTMYYQIADFIPAQFIPPNWHGFTTGYRVTDEPGFKTIFQVGDSIVDTARAYTIKCKVVKFYESFSTECESIDALYTDLQEYKNYYLLNYNDILDLPIFEGQIGVKPSAQKETIMIRQNTKWVGISKKGSGTSNINVGSLFFPRQWVRNAKYVEGLNWQYTGDVSTNPVGTFMVTPYTITSNYTSVRTDLVANAIPFFMNFCSDGSFMWSKSTEAQTRQIKDFDLNDFLPGGNLINTQHYGYKQDTINAFTQLPYISGGQIRAFGDGQHSLDSTLVDNYSYNNRTFYSDDPLRYAYVDTYNVNVTTRYSIRAVYWVITYIDNDIQTLSVNSKLRPYWYGHVRDNEFN